MEILQHTQDRWYKTRILLSLIAILVITIMAFNYSFNTIPKGLDEYSYSEDENDVMEIKQEVKVMAEKKVVIVEKKKNKPMTLAIVPDEKEIVIPDEVIEVIDSSFSVVEDTSLLVQNIEPVAQTIVVPEVMDKNEVLNFSEFPPEFPGGEKQLLKYLQRHLNYPMFEEEIGMEGEVVATFVVNSDGSVGNVVIVRSTSDGFAREASKVLVKMPSWSPGMHNGKAVAVRYSLPVRFRL